MNKRSNPFFPQQTSYPHPPLPPGPPPPQIPQYDYSAYWSSLQGGQPAQSQPIPQWPAQGVASAPGSGSTSQIPPNQLSLYANYGYGRQNFSWQRQPQNVQQQQQQRQVFPLPQPPPPMVQPYFPAQGAPNRPFNAAPQAYSNAVPQSYRPQPLMVNQPPPPQHSPPQLPPAKRPRFEGPQPGSGITSNGTTQAGNRLASNNIPSRPTGPSNETNMRGTAVRGRGGIGGGNTIATMRGGSNVGGRGGRGSSSRGIHASGHMGSHRGGRGGWHGQGNRRGGGNRARGSGFSHTNHAREGTFSKANSTPMDKDRSVKKEEARQTLTDFRIIGLEIECLNWKWGSCPLRCDPIENTEGNKDLKEDVAALALADNVEEIEFGSAIQETTDHVPPEEDSSTQSHTEKNSHPKEAQPDGYAAMPPSVTSPPRMRIYFNTPMSSEDPKSVGTGVPNVNRAKRKMSEEADEEGPRTRTKLNPPVEDDVNDTESKAADIDKERASVAPSVDISATASISGRTDDERDWLMEAIAHDDEASELPTAEDVHDESVVDAQCANEEEPPTVDVEETGEASQPVGVDKGGSPDHSPLQSPENAASFPSGEHIQASSQASVMEPIEASVDEMLEYSNHQVELEQNRAENMLNSGHDPEPPASPASQDNPSQAQSSQPINGSISGPKSLPSVPKGLIGAQAQSSSQRLLSPNRVSISYASGARRILIDAQIVESMKIWRKSGKIEILLGLEREGDSNFKGLVAETYSHDKQSYASATFLDDDSLVPPLAHVVSPSKIAVLVYLDKDKPMTEPRWVKTGDLEEWLRNTFGLFWARRQAGWEKRIEVADPDPPPTIHTVLETWSTCSLVGLESERQRFVKTHMSERDNLLEILLRLVRGERATPGSFHNGSPLSNLHLSGPLLTALSPSSSHAAQQTHLTLAIVAMVRMSESFAEKSLPKDQAQCEVDEHVGEIIRCLPQHLLYKSLDGIFREWKDTKKRGGRM